MILPKSGGMVGADIDLMDMLAAKTGFTMNFTRANSYDGIVERVSGACRAANRARLPKKIEN